VNPLEPLERVLSAVLVWLHETLGVSWAWSIVALTVIVRMLLVPLVVRQVHSMQHLQRYAPEMKAIQQRYKHDRQRMNEELMTFYREKGVNPAASCLPVLFQLPVFLSLYFVLRNFETQILPGLHEPLQNLGWLGVVPDITAAAGSDWSGYLLLAIYATSQTVSTLLTPTAVDPRQRVLLLALPLVFLVAIARFPAGLVLYWVTTNLWATGQGIVTRRLLPRPEAGATRSTRQPVVEPATKLPPARSESIRRVKRKKKGSRRG
jgi:YidC/Oxa1 family membrane protein insertase